MSTPAQLIMELRAIHRHYAETAERKARLLALMENQTGGTWANPTRIPLVPGRLYFVRVKWAKGGFSPASIWKWSNTVKGWSTVYGTEHKLVDGDQLQVLVPVQGDSLSPRQPRRGRA